MIAKAWKAFVAGAAAYGGGASQLTTLGADLATLPGVISGAGQGLNTMAFRRVYGSIDTANALRAALTAISGSSLDGMKAMHSYAVSRKLNFRRNSRT